VTVPQPRSAQEVRAVAHRGLHADVHVHPPEQAARVVSVVESRGSQEAGLHRPRVPTLLNPATAAVRLDHLESFVVLASVLNYAVAARRLHLSTPGLSRRITKLEHAVGHALFSRTTRSVTLAPHGHLLLPPAQRILADIGSFAGSGPVTDFCTGRPRT
jgi:hypothetical protein